MILGIKESINQLETLRNEGKEFKNIELLEKDVKALEVAIGTLKLIDNLKV